MEQIAEQRENDTIFALFAAFTAGAFLVSFLTLQLFPDLNFQTIPSTQTTPYRQKLQEKARARPERISPAPEIRTIPPPPPNVNDTTYLRTRHLLMPVQGISREALVDSFYEGRGTSRMHEAIDILAPRNTPVVAVEDGIIERLWYSDNGGNTIYEFDPSRTYAYYYAHLENYAGGLKEGQSVRKGEVIGYVGTSGNAPPDTPHLHFTIFKLTPAKHWWEGTAINPYPILKEP